MELAKQLAKLGTETAFAVSQKAADWASQGHKVYPFHLGDINLATPENITEAAKKALADGFTGYCPGAGIPELRDAVARDVGAKRGLSYSAENVAIQPGGKPVIGKFISVMRADLGTVNCKFHFVKIIIRLVIPPILFFRSIRPCFRTSPTRRSISSCG